MSLNKVEFARDVPFIEQTILEMEPDAVLCGAALMFKLPPDENGIVNTVTVAYGETALHIENFGKATHLIPVEGDLGYFGPLQSGGVFDNEELEKAAQILADQES